MNRKVFSLDNFFIAQIFHSKVVFISEVNNSIIKYFGVRFFEIQKNQDIVRWKKHYFVVRDQILKRFNLLVGSMLKSLSNLTLKTSENIISVWFALFFFVICHSIKHRTNISAYFVQEAQFLTSNIQIVACISYLLSIHIMVAIFMSSFD